MIHKYTAMTAQKAIRLGFKPSRTYGYVVHISPPLIYKSTGEDVEWIGWVNMSLKITHQHFFGWYKHKDTAENRAYELNNSSFNI